MNKIAVVGHPASGYREVESLLHQCGMRPAQPSRRESLSPQDISEMLCKVHGAPPIGQVTSEEEVQQVQAGALWHCMALDLMLGNLAQPLWGWADPQALFLLDYWRSLDPKLTFVLVYDEPHRVLIEGARSDCGPPSGQALHRMLDNWVAYNAALLRFYLRHPGRCLLVHSQQVSHAADSYLQQLQPLLDTPLGHLALPRAASLADRDEAADQTPLSLSNCGRLPAAIAVAVAAAGMQQHEAAARMDARAAECHLVDSVLADHPTVLQLYAELQSAANLPLEARQRWRGDAAGAWESLIRQRFFMADLVVQIHTQFQRVNSLLSEASGRLEQSRAQHGRLREQADAEALALREQVTRLTTKVSDVEGQAKEQARENKLLLVELHQVQEELERHYLRKFELEQEGKRKTEQLAQQISVAKEALEAERVAQAEAAAERNKVQSRLEQTQTEHARLHGQATAEAHALREQIRQLTAQLSERDAQAKANESVTEAAIEAEKVATAKMAAERDKRVKELADENGLLLTQLHEVQEELERYYLDNQRLKAKHSPPKPSGPYGAADRIKSQLSYRLGAVMIQRSQTVGGWLGMPWALVAEVRAFNKQHAEKPVEKLPPLHTYADAHRAERAKQHLSYRLGSTLLKHGTSPIGWVRLPVALNREVKQFRQSQRHQLQKA